MGNYDQELIIYGQEFINFCSKLKQFSLNLMKEIVTFSKKTSPRSNKKHYRSSSNTHSADRKNEYDNHRSS